MAHLWNWARLPNVSERHSKAGLVCQKVAHAIQVLLQQPVLLLCCSCAAAVVAAAAIAYALVQPSMLLLCCCHICCTGDNPAGTQQWLCPL